MNTLVTYAIEYYDPNYKYLIRPEQSVLGAGRAWDMAIKANKSGVTMLVTPKVVNASVKQLRGYKLGDPHFTLSI